MRRRDRSLLILAIVIVVAIAIRAFMPFVVKDYVNRKLAALEAYEGHVDDVDIALWRGAYSIN